MLISRKFPLAYLETDYFGGRGRQSAIACDGGQLVFGPESGDTGPVNNALARIGVLRNAVFDEFDVLELGRFREMDNFPGCEEPDES